MIKAVLIISVMGILLVIAVTLFARSVSGRHKKAIHKLEVNKLRTNKMPTDLLQESKTDDEYSLNGG